jgi:ribosomal protein S18 acetylase RimI-like enzyme
MEGIRRANLADTEQITRFDHAARIDPPREQLVSRSIANGQCHVYEQGGAVVAYAVLEYSFYGNGFVSMLYVHPERRREGIGAKLMQHIESLCRTDKLFTSINESNTPMQALVEKVGYQPSGRIENLDEDDPELVYFKKLNAGGA